MSHVHIKYIVTGRVTIRDGRDNEIQSMCPDLSLTQPSNWQGPKQGSSKHACLVLFSSFCATGAGLKCGVHPQQVLATSSSTKKVSCSTFALLVCEPITSTNQINRDKSSATFKLVVASVSKNNALPFSG